MQITGKLIKVLPLQSGISKTGSEWKKQDFVIETEGAYPKTVCFSCWGDRIPSSAVLQEGNKLRIDFDPESREFNGKWYTDLKAWKVEVDGGTGDMSSSMASGEPVIDINDDKNISSQEVEDDLPF